VDVILLTAFGTVEEAVRAMKDGATDFLTQSRSSAPSSPGGAAGLERRDLIAPEPGPLQKRLDDLLRRAI